MGGWVLIRRGGGFFKLQPTSAMRLDQKGHLDTAQLSNSVHILISYTLESFLIELFLNLKNRVKDQCKHFNAPKGSAAMRIPNKVRV